VQELYVLYSMAVPPKREALLCTEIGGFASGDPQTMGEWVCKNPVCRGRRRKVGMGSVISRDFMDCCDRRD
jgi:hypothetical protein